MPAYRFYLDAPFTLHKSYTLEKSEHAHIRVMRLREGDELELINGRGQFAKGLLEKNGSINIVDLEEQPIARRVVICQAIPRINRLDIIVEKGTELGMTDLWLFPGERSEKRQVGENRLKRLQAISIAALKQSGRLHLPQIVERPPLNAWDALDHAAYFGDLTPDAPPFNPPETNICFFIGPEAGLTQQEETKLRELGAVGVKLGPYTLRTDTAPLVALSLIQA